MRRTFMRRWVFAVTAGETVGFIIPAAVGGALTFAAAPDSVVYPLMIAAGACEGILLGLGQSIGFGSFGIPSAAWITATGVGAAVAWSIGMLPSTIGGVDFTSPSALALVVVGAAVLLASIPTLQWLVLRRVIRRASWWIPVNAGAWAAGILWTFAPSPFIDENTAFPALLGSYLVAGMLMAVTVGALTGFAARHVVESTHYSPAQGTDAGKSVHQRPAP